MVLPALGQTEADLTGREHMGFEPCFESDSRILILGSFPSVISRKELFYYANPLNRFWKTLAKLTGETLPESTADKKAFLSRHRIALWDVVTECDIRGSLDSNIKNYAVADVGKILNAAKIEAVFLNGQTAYRIFKKHFPSLSSLAVLLPSTSPANTRFDYAEWEKALSPYLE